MKRTYCGFAAAVASLCLATTLASAAQWDGPNLIQNGTFDQGLSSWTVKLGSWSWNYWSAKSTYNGGIQGNYADSGISPDTALQQTVSLVSGKRYSVSGDGYSLYNPYAVVYGRLAGFIDASGLVRTDKWLPSPTPNPSYKSVTGIAASNSTVVSCVASVYVNQSWSGVDCAFDNINLHQIVYTPQLQIAQSSIRVNTNNALDPSATGSLTFNSLSIPDDPTANAINWGDGSTDNNLPINTTQAHTYSMTSGNTQDFTVTFTGTNQADTASTTALVQLLRHPTTLMTINNTAITNGQTVRVWSGAYTILDPSNSQGYIENSSLVIPGRVNQSSPNLSPAAVRFNAGDAGTTFTLTANVSNTGQGANSDTLIVNLLVANANVGLTANGGTGTHRGSVITSGSNGWYCSTVFDENGTAGDASGYIDVLGTLPTPGTDKPVLALLDLVGSASDISDLLNHLSGIPSFTVLQAGNPDFDKLASLYGGADQTWDAVVEFNSLPNGTSAGNLKFSWDFTGTGVAVDKIVVVPEPASLALLGLGIIGMLVRRRSICG
ncbi:MAG: PEP-CTERM sorting domain-containing protein [Phycisphaerae bacterium]